MWRQRYTLNTPSCNLTHMVLWFGLCACDFALCIHIHSWSESFPLVMIAADEVSRDFQSFMFLHKSIAVFCCWGGGNLPKNSNNRVVKLLTWWSNSGPLFLNQCSPNIPLSWHKQRTNACEIQLRIHKQHKSRHKGCLYW